MSPDEKRPRKGPRINADERGSEKRNAVESSRKVNENGSGR
jgi:hypothetical protein